MNLIDYNKVVEALEKERQYLLSREQYGAEHVLVHHAMNVISELPIIRQPEIVRCKDCKNRFDGCCYNRKSDRTNFGVFVADDWFCGDGEKEMIGWQDCMTDGYSSQNLKT